MFKDEFLDRLRHSPEPGVPRVELPERLCPRCKLPIEVVYNSFQTGRSRKDRSIEICAPCASHEGMCQLTGIDLATQEWPIAVPRNYRY